MNLVTILIVVFVLLAIIASAIMWFSDRIKHQIASRMVEEEMVKIDKAAKEEIETLPDPDRPINPKEVQDALRKLRDFGRRPL